MPLTRNQHAALQTDAHGHVTGGEGAANSDPSSSALHAKSRNSSAGNPDLASLGSAGGNATDWVSFGQGTSLTDDVFSQEHPAFHTSPHSSPFYRLPTSSAQHPQQHQNQDLPTHFLHDSPHGMQHEQQRERRQRTADENFMANLHSQMAQLSPDKPFEELPQRSNIFAAAGFPAVTTAASAAAVSAGEPDLGTAFSTPTPVTRTQAQQDHARTYSMDSSESMSVQRSMHRRDMMHHRTPGSAGSSISMDVDNADGMTHPSMSASSLKRIIGNDAASRMRQLERQSRSLGQVGAAMSGGDDGLLRLGGPLKPIDASTFDRFGMQPNSARSISPPEHSGPGFMGNFSPHSSISTARHAGDSSIDTSTDSISNSATTMSAVPSQASSISDDFLGAKKMAKVKTRLRNIDRKAICEAARDDPKVRQEDLAARFGIERSTVSKTLKNKDKWLAIEDNGDGAYIVKHRTGKFPQLEERLAKWINDEVGSSTPILDVTIKHRALQLAKDLDIGQDQFKASVGWIDKFRERYKLPKAFSSPDGHQSGQPSIEEAQRRAQAFRSGLALAAAQQAGVQTENDMSMFYSPPNSQINLIASASTPQRPRSTSDEVGTSGLHETPKASKRQYDDMANNRASSSIDASMARMHLPGQNAAQAGTDSGHGNGGLLSHQHDDSGYAMAPSSSSSSSSASNAVDANTSKRRKATAGPNKGTETDVSTIQQHDDIPLAALREQLRRTQNTQLFSNAGAGTQQQDSSVAAAAAAAVQEIRRSEEAQRLVEQRQQQSRGGADMNLIRGLQRNVSSPSGQQGAIHGVLGQQAQSTTASPSVYTETPPPRHDILGMLQSADMSASGSPIGSIVGGAGDDRRVTLEEARESLDVVLAFIARQPANLSPSDYFVLGNLQGQLSALANQGQDPMSGQHHSLQQPQEQQQKQQQQEQKVQNRHQQQQDRSHPNNSSLNLLGISGDDLSMVSDLTQQSR